ncbi:apolipoprotein D [Drosophila eugracilis]|uniref:apolipoprotein D n=1 Tax=Drosophila eugracilis TaxID=29029 RepID=UPI0007E5D03F|nr:apolipoprotein D [Drosophila eugracilis]
MINWKFFIFALIDIQFSLAMKAFHGACPVNMTAVGDFDMDRFIGKWYTHSIYPPVSSKIARCQSTEFIRDDEHKYRVKARELSGQTDTVRVRKAQILKVESNFGRYILGTKNAAFPEGVLLYVLDTDYTTFAIRFMCFDASHIFSFHWAAIQTRKRLPSTDVVYMAQYYAKQAGLVISDMSKVPQESCPPDT